MDRRSYQTRAHVLEELGVQPVESSTLGAEAVT